MATAAVESWDDDDDFQGDFNTFAAASTGTGPLSMSSRMSTRSESVAGDEDWNVVLQSNDADGTTQAINSAKQAGIPIPENVPSSALVGGTIKRLGKKTPKQRVEDWDNDLEMPDQPLQLKERKEDTAVLSCDDFDDFDDLEGSLGIRGGGKTETTHPSESASIMSPSLGSATAESEADEAGGLELPEGPIDLQALLKKRRATEAELSDKSQPNSHPSSAVVEQEPPVNQHKKSRVFEDDGDDFFADLGLAEGDVLNVRKRGAHRNVQVRSTKPPPSALRPATTLNFHDRSTNKPIYTRIPRPVSGTRQTSRLDPVFENSFSHANRDRRGPTTTGSQLLRSKRSMPALRNQSQNSQFPSKPLKPFLPAGVSNQQSAHATSQRPMPIHLRRDSDPSRQGTRSPPPPRPSSRLSNQMTTPDTPSRTVRQRENVAPAALARQAAAKQSLTRPTRKRNYGDGSELAMFDDLPTSAAKEHKFVKQPVARGLPKQATLRHAYSRSDLTDLNKRNSAITVIPDRIMTPAPRTPVSPTKGFHEAPSATPSYLRDTAASRIARESRLVNQPRPKSEGPLQPMSTNWKAQVSARSPFSSPSAKRGKPKRPALIAGIGSNVLPAGENVQVQNGMIFDPLRMKWLKEEEEDDPFAGIEDLREVPPGYGSLDSAADRPMDHVAESFKEEFDIGETFVRMQKLEEEQWQKMCGSWFPFGQPRPDDGAWRYDLRNMKL